MPPRKAPRNRTSAAPPSLHANDSFPPSAANQVYNLVEIRSRILRCLGKGDLATCMRVEKKGVYEVAKELYREISYQRAVSMKRTTARQRIYVDAVSVIDANDITSEILPNSLKRQLQKLAEAEYGISASSGFDQWDFDQYPRNYSEGAFSLFVPPLREGFPNLRKISALAESTGDLDRAAMWSVTFARQSGSGPGAASVGDAIVGHIELISVLSDYLDTHPPVIAVRTPAPPGYTLSERVNLSLELGNEWVSRESAMAFLRDRWFFDHLHTSISFDSLPISLGDIVDLYERQAASGYCERLQRVSAEGVLPWDITSFQLLATTASTFLTSLTLFGEIYPPTSSKVPCTDLPSIISAVLNDLPNLTLLGIEMGDFSEAEATCKDLLVGSCLEAGGSLTTLNIETTSDTPPLLNLVRLLSTICASDATICIGPTVRHWRKGQSRDEQGELLRYLRRQPSHRRTHLSTIDFSSLDASTYSDVHRLEYHTDGRPRRLGETRSARWSNATHVSSHLLVKTTSSFDVADQLREFANKADHLRSLATSAATTEEMLAEAEKLLVAAREVVRKSEMVSAAVLVAAEKMEQTEGDIAAYVESLRAIVEGEARVG